MYTQVWGSKEGSNHGEPARLQKAEREGGGKTQDAREEHLQRLEAGILWEPGAHAADWGERMGNVEPSSQGQGLEATEFLSGTGEQWDIFRTVVIRPGMYMTKKILATSGRGFPHFLSLKGWDHIPYFALIAYPEVICH